MDKSYWITRAGDFEAVIDMEIMHTMTNANFTRLLRIAFSAFDENEVELDLLGAYLERRGLETLEAWEQASLRYRNEWRLAKSKNWRDPMTSAILQHNRELKNNVERARSIHQRYTTLKTIFEKEKEKNK